MAVHFGVLLLRAVPACAFLALVNIVGRLAGAGLAYCCSRAANRLTLCVVVVVAVVDSAFDTFFFLVFFFFAGMYT